VSDTTEETAAETAKEISDNGLGPAVLASVGSVALALYFYYVRGDKQRGQFVGFWPVTILALASYFKLEEIQEMLDERDVWRRCTAQQVRESGFQPGCRRIGRLPAKMP
jgi:hypothetical protein